MVNFDPYNVLLAIATNIPVLLMTAFVLQGHIYDAGQQLLGQKCSCMSFVSYLYHMISDITRVLFMSE